MLLRFMHTPSLTHLQAAGDSKWLPWLQMFDKQYQKWNFKPFPHVLSGLGMCVHQPEFKLFKFIAVVTHPKVQFGKENVLCNINGKLRIWKKTVIFFGKLLIFPFQKDEA